MSHSGMDPFFWSRMTELTRHTFRPWQDDMAERIRGQSRVALFVEMRLGKTPVIIRWAQEQYAAIPRERVLVVGPMNVLDDWEDELQREGIPRVNIHRLDQESTRTRMESASVDWGWFLVHKEGVRLTTELAAVDWDILIIDESTIIRNPKAQITKALVDNFGHVPNRAILTGDPRPESELDYFMQMKFLHGDFMGYGNYWAFRNHKFIQNPRTSWQWIPGPGLRDAIKSYVHNRAVVMTAAAVGMANDQITKVRTVDMNEAQRRATQQIVHDFQYEEMQTKFATVRDIWLARIAGGFSPDRTQPKLLSPAKADGIVELMTGELKHEASVIWFRFNEELAYVTDRLNAAGVPTVGVSGATPKRDRRHLRARFTDGTYRCICVQVQLGRMGWNLARASVAQYYSNAYDYESRAQSMKRIEHMTKKQPLLYIDWVTRGTIDREVVQLLKEKRMNSRQFMRRLNTVALSQLRSLYGFKGEVEKTGSTANRGSGRRVYPGSTGG